MKIGITGTIASGKTTVSYLMKKRGYPVFNADRYAGMCLHHGNPVCEKIAEAFPEVMDENQDVDRKKMSEMVFSDEDKRKLLNSLVHPYVIEGMKNFFVHQKKVPFVFAEVPLLFEAGLEDDFDKIIVVTCEKETAIKRMMEDREYTKEQAEARLSSQIDGWKQIEKADYVLHNDGDLKQLNDEINQIFKELRKERREAC